MKRVFSFFACMLFVAGCSFGPSEAMLDDFEGPLMKETVDYGAAEGSNVEVKAATNQKVCGAQSLEITYNLKPSGYMWIARGAGLEVKGARWDSAKPSEVPWGKFNALSVYMKGSGSSGVIAFDIKDAGGELWRFLLDDEGEEWREIICPFDEFFPRNDWQPDTADKNEVLDFPIQSFQFEPRLPGKSVLYFDCVKAVKVKK